MAITSFSGLDKSVKYVPSDDDAIDHENCDYDEYFKTFDLSKLVFLEGKEPTIFHLRPLSPMDRGLVSDAAKGSLIADPGTALEYSMCRQLVRASLCNVDNLSHWVVKNPEILEQRRPLMEDMELVPVEYKEETIVLTGGIKRRVAGKTILNAIAPTLMLDIAAAVLMISVPSPDQKKNLF